MYINMNFPCWNWAGADLMRSINLSLKYDFHCFTFPGMKPTRKCQGLYLVWVAKWVPLCVDQLKPGAKIHYTKGNIQKYMPQKYHN